MLWSRREKRGAAGASSQELKSFWGKLYGSTSIVPIFEMRIHSSFVNLDRDRKHFMWRSGCGAARNNYANRQYTEAIARLHEAAEIDPGHAEVQQLLFTVTTRQKKRGSENSWKRSQTRSRITLTVKDFAQAQDRVTRALESLPGEGLLVRLKVEVESRKRRGFDTHRPRDRPC